MGPQELRTCDATIAQDIFAGRLTFAGRHVDTGGGSIFDVAPPSYSFAEELHGFGWLRHIRAADSPETRQSARDLVADWIDLYGRTGSGFAMNPHVLSRRMMSWISQAPILLDGAETEFYQAFLGSLSSQAALLHKELKLGVPPLVQLSCVIALAYYAFCSDAPNKLLTSAERRLLLALEQEILPDGGHVSRNPQLLLDGLLDLLPLQQVFSARGKTIPKEIPDATGRMLALLRMLRHADGVIGAFNGMGATESGLIARILPYVTPGEAITLDASYSGYQRLENGPSVLLVDAGRTPPVRWSGSAHGGCLSLEFSSHNSRIFVNCGAALAISEPARQLSRLTAAHSVLILDDTSSCRFATDGRLRKYFGDTIIEGPTELTYGRQQAEDGEMLVARHDGYGKEFGLIHQRSLWLGEAGLRLEGQDALLGLAKAPSGRKRRGAKSQKEGKIETTILPPFTVRFHLHPSVRASLDASTSLESSSGQVTLMTGQGEKWQFSAHGFAIALEESIYFATPQGRQKTLQIVLSGLAQSDLLIDWVLERIHP